MAYVEGRSLLVMTGLFIVCCLLLCAFLLMVRGVLVNHPVFDLEKGAYPRPRKGVQDVLSDALRQKVD
jgi:hypothetical protein